MTTEVQQCQHCACDLDVDQEMISKFKGHDISIDTAAFHLTPPTGGLLDRECDKTKTTTPTTHADRLTHTHTGRSIAIVPIPANCVDSVLKRLAILRHCVGRRRRIRTIIFADVLSTFCRHRSASPESTTPATHRPTKHRSNDYFCAVLSMTKLNCTSALMTFVVESAVKQI